MFNHCNVPGLPAQLIQSWRRCRQVCLVYCGWHAYTFLTKVKPQRDRLLQERQQQLLLEGAPLEQELEQGKPRVQY